MAPRAVRPTTVAGARTLPSTALFLFHNPSISHTIDSELCFAYHIPNRSLSSVFSGTQSLPEKRQQQYTTTEVHRSSGFHCIPFL